MLRAPGTASKLRTARTVAALAAHAAFDRLRAAPEGFQERWEKCDDRLQNQDLRYRSQISIPIVW